jgi:hypothetical protein
MSSPRELAVLVAVALALAASPFARLASEPTGRRLAAKLANDECERRYERRPFSPSQHTRSSTSVIGSDGVGSTLAGRMGSLPKSRSDRTAVTPT